MNTAYCCVTVSPATVQVSMPASAPPSLNKEERSRLVAGPAIDWIARYHTRKLFFSTSQIRWPKALIWIALDVSNPVTASA